MFENWSTNSENWENECPAEDRFFYQELYDLCCDFVGQDWIDCIAGDITRKELAGKLGISREWCSHVMQRKIRHLRPWLKYHGYTLYY